jgi:hypothetical protein
VASEGEAQLWRLLVPPPPSALLFLLVLEVLLKSKASKENLISGQRFVTLWGCRTRNNARKSGLQAGKMCSKQKCFNVRIGLNRDACAQKGVVTVYTSHNHDYLTIRKRKALPG